MLGHFFSWSAFSVPQLMDGSDVIVLSEEEGSWLGEYQCEVELDKNLARLVFICL